MSTSHHAAQYRLPHGVTVGALPLPARTSPPPAARTSGQVRGRVLMGRRADWHELRHLERAELRRMVTGSSSGQRLAELE